MTTTLFRRLERALPLSTSAIEWSILSNSNETAQILVHRKFFERQLVFCTPISLSGTSDASTSTDLHSLYEKQMKDIQTERNNLFGSNDCHNQDFVQTSKLSNSSSKET